MKKSAKTILVISIAIVITIILCIVINKTGRKTSVGGPQRRSAQGGASTIVTVRSTEAKVQTLDDYVLTNGEVESQTAVEVFPSMNGKISKINVMLGSHVEKGEIIAYVDPSEPGSNYAQSPVEAPISGSIVTMPLKVGAKVGTTSAITMIGDIENLQITVPVPERYIAELKPGLKAEVTLEAYPDVIFNATVIRVSPVVDKASRTKEIILNFDKKDSRIDAGMFAKVKLYTSSYGGYIVAPKDAVVEDEEQSYLFIVNDDETVSKRNVKLGKSVDSLVQITDNVMPGERIVMEGMLSLSDGAKVNDISNPKAQTENPNSVSEGNN